MKGALEELTTVGSVGVDRRDADKPACGYEYTVHFEPWAGDTLPYILNYGELPDIVVRGTRGASRGRPQTSHMLDSRNSSFAGTSVTVLAPLFLFCRPAPF